MDYKKIFKSQKNRLRILNFFRFVPDRVIIEIEYRMRIGKRLNLKQPKTFNEKLQWLKLYDRKDIYTTMVDKFAVKRYLTEKIGEKYVVPLLGCWDNAESIDFNKLPDQFVLKCNHDSGSVVICTDKSKLDMKMVKKKLDFHMKIDAYALGREWPYKNIKRKIIAEELLLDSEHNDTDIKDYKFFCFDGVPKIMYISNDRGENPRTDFFDMNFKHLPIQMKDPNAEIMPKKPEMFDEMKKIAGVLSKNIPQLRVDFYVVGKRIYVGELTFYHNSGFTPVKPEEWNNKLGEWIKLPEINLMNSNNIVK